MDAAAATNPFDLHDDRVVVAMVGLPARGKSYLSHAIVRHMTYGGCPARLFNPGNVRRNHGLSGVGSGFFDSSNGHGASARDGWAMDCLEDLLGWIRRTPTPAAGGNGVGGGGGGGGCSVGILDATNSTVERRKKIIDRCQRERRENNPNIKLLFLEAYSDDTELLERYYRMKLDNDDYRGMDPDRALADFRERVEKYRAVYEPISEREGQEGDKEDGHGMSYVRHIDAGRRIVCNNVGGYVLGRVRQLICSVQIRPRTIWLALVGETENDAKGVLGGDTELSEAGMEYTRDLSDLIRERERYGHDHTLSSAGGNKGVIYTGTLRRYKTTAEILCGGSTQNSNGSNGHCSHWPKYHLLTLPAANDLHRGGMDSLSLKECKDRYPNDGVAREADALTYRYPGLGGETLRELIARYNEVLFLLEQTCDNSIVICDRPLYQVVFGYFMGKSIDEIPHLNVKPGLLELARTEINFEVAHFPVNSSLQN